MDLDAAVTALGVAQAAEDRAKQRAVQIVTDARAEVARSRQMLHAAIVDAYLAGMRQKAIVERTGMTRESIRRILRASGVEANE